MVNVQHNRYIKENASHVEISVSRYVAVVK
jgi:hypothetical protein